MKIFLLFSLFVLFTVLKMFRCEEDYKPIVLWHGMGDSCCFPFSLGAFKESLNKSMPGVYVLSLRIGNSVISDVENGYFLHPDEQIKLACDIIKGDEKLKNGFNAIGFSQGAQFLRGLVQRCEEARVKNLISLGGQHQGVYGLPQCGSLSHSLCDYIRKLLNHAAYLSWVQKFLVQATYWHDPLNEELYKNSSTFLSEINNEKEVKTAYVENLKSLTNFVMIKFGNDTMVEPVDSEWFGFYKTGQSVKTESLQDSAIYKEDRLGLREMDQMGKLKFLSVPGNHLQVDWDWFEENIVNVYLRH